MSFAAPWALLFLLAVVPLIWMYLFRDRERTRQTPSLLFWERLTLNPSPARSFHLHRFVPPFIFFIQLVLIILIVGALAEPSITRSARRIVLTLDLSASMQTREHEGPRFALAAAEARRLIDAMEDADRMALVTAGARPERRVDFTSDRSLLTRALESIEPGDAPADIPAALSLAAAMRDSGETLDIVLISDQTSEETPYGETGSAVRLHTIVVGETDANVGFVGLAVRSGDDAGAELTLRNFTAQTCPGRLKIVQDSRTLMDEPVELPPDAMVPVVVQAVEDAGPVMVTMETADSLEVDNTVYFLPSSEKNAALLAVTSHPGFSRLIRQMDEYEVTVVSGLRDIPASKSFDLYVFDRIIPDVYPPGGTVVIHPPDTESSDDASPCDWESRHPLLRDVVVERLSFTGLPLPEAVPPWAEILARTASRAAVMAGVYEGHRRVMLGAGLMADLENPAALILFLRSLDWVQTQDVRSATHIRTGEPYLYPAPGKAGEVDITTPSGARFPALRETGMLSFPETNRVGIYTLRLPDGPRPFAANLLDASESDIRTVRTGAAPVDAAPFRSDARIDAPFGDAVLYMTLALLSFWWFYEALLQRKKP